MGRGFNLIKNKMINNNKNKNAKSIVFTICFNFQNFKKQTRIHQISFPIVTHLFRRLFRLPKISR